MTTTGQHTSKNPTIRRILREAAELASAPSADYHATPLETDLFEWHFTLRGPPTPSPFAGGLYHGRIVLPPAYPLKPPSFRFLTPSGRFEVNREICLSISGHHEETWQPAWGIRTSLVALRAFMDTSAGGQLGGMAAGEATRRKLAGESKGWGCRVCGRRNEEVMGEQEGLAKEAEEEGGGGRGEEVVPEGLRLAYREDLAAKTDGSAKATGVVETAKADAPIAAPVQVAVSAPSSAQAAIAPTPPTRTQTLPPPPTQAEALPAWIDKAIYAIIAVLAFLIWKRLLS